LVKSKLVKSEENLLLEDEAKDTFYQYFYGQQPFDFTVGNQIKNDRLTTRSKQDAVSNIVKVQ